jgi:prepilin-type N-terminal cleavage/methylation domain-containing protein
MDGIKNQKSFTLIEIVVAMGIFSLLVGSLSSIFVQALQGQRKTLATQEVLEQTSYVLDYMSRALRMAKKDVTGSCTGPDYITYITTNSRVLDGKTFTGPGIKFINSSSICQEFFLDNASSTLKESQSGAAPVDLTSKNIKINSFNIYYTGTHQNDTTQPKVTFFLDIEGKNQSRIKVQTTVSQRNLDIQIQI